MRCLLFKAKTIADQIYEDLRSDIVQLKYYPGDKISEAQLAVKYNVSRAPIRDAIRKLQQEKLVLVKPQSGTIVSPVLLDTAVKICEVRMLLEPYAAEVAAQKINSEIILMLKNQFDKLNRINKSKEKKSELIFETDKILHKCILQLCGNEEIELILSKYADEINRVRLATIKLADRAKPTQIEMKRIYKALIKKDPKKAKNEMYHHILNFKRALEFIMNSGTTKNI